VRAAWWWIDRWRKSTAYTDFTPEQRGMYRDLLDEVWLREDHVIPDDDRILGLIVGDPEAWKRQRKSILRHFRRVEGGWTNDTALEVIGKSLQLSEKRSAAGKKGNEVRWAEHRKEIANAIANPIATASSPSPSPSPVSIGTRKVDRLEGGNGPDVRSNPLIPAGGRPKLEIECLNLVTRMAALTGEDPIDVIARASGYEGAKRTKLNPASMTDDRLLNTIRDLRADVTEEERARGKKVRQ
jgi:uncharacterized protein YdaU (DUF1376 family)